MTNNAAEMLRQLNTAEKQVKARLRKNIRDAGKDVVAKARGEASWSSRIPAAIRMSTSFSQRNPGVKIQVSRKKAPHARPFEDRSGTGYFRHPVFGRTANPRDWVQQDARPFLSEAMKDSVDRIREQVAKSVDDAARDAGFK